MNLLILALAAFGLYVIVRFGLDILVGYFAARQLRRALEEMDRGDS
jgi:hypothetical protein